MVTLSTALERGTEWSYCPSSGTGDWFSAFDLQDVYFNITILPTGNSADLFWGPTISIQGTTFWPFCSSQDIFQNLVGAAAHLCEQGIIIITYVDDCPLKASSRADVIEAIRKTVDFFSNVGLQINMEKLKLRHLKFIGAQMDATQARAFVLSQIFDYSQSCLHCENLVFVRICLQLLGHMAAVMFVVKHVRLHICCLQGCLRTVYVSYRHSLKNCY